MQITKHFSLHEINSSSVADSLNIRNELPVRFYDNIKRLCHELEKARDILGMPIRVTSGYRCPALNRAVNGAKNSYHMYGRAVDLHCDDMQSLFEVLNSLPHVELIYHYPTYIHYAL